MKQMLTLIWWYLLAVENALQLLSGAHSVKAKLEHLKVIELVVSSLVD